MKGNFTLWPVGEGLFYSGQLLDKNKQQFNFVYDCGAKSAKVVNSCVDKFQKKYNPKQIDILFLSHYDSDHIKGIEKLAKKLKIKKIIAPMITPCDELSWFLNRNGGNGNIEDSVRNRINQIEADFSEVNTISNENDLSLENTGEIDGAISDSFDSSNRNVFHKGIYDSSNNLNKNNHFVWEFTFFAQNYQQSWLNTWIDNFIQSIKSSTILQSEAFFLNGNTSGTVEDKAGIIYGALQSFLGDSLKTSHQKENVINEIIYLAKSGRKSGKYSNGVSLILYHGPINVVNQMEIDQRMLNNGKTIHSDRVGQFLMGDAYLKNYNATRPNQYWKNIEKVFPVVGPHSYNNKIGLCLVPHHGAKNGWVNELFNYSNCFMVSYGLHNGYKHPSYDVNRQFKSNHQKYRYDVTENSASQLDIKIR